MSTQPSSVQDVIAQAGAIDGAGFAALVADASDPDLRTLMSDETARDVVLGRIFEQMPARLHADRAKGMDETIHWIIGGRPSGGSDLFEVHIHDGRATVRRDGSAKARVTLEIDPVAFLRMIAGQTNGMKLMLSRKLKVKGDMMFAPRMESLFDTNPASL